MSEWYKNAIFYALDVQIFMDSDGNGIGDFKGATSKLDYLADLGVSAIWLLPFYLSPERDNGYDVIDHYIINPNAGTIADFIEFVEEAEKRNIHIVVDLIMNHTSDQHPWFQAARYNPDSIFHNYYIWRDSPPSQKEENIFVGTENSTWKYDDVAKKYFYHKFYSFQPDINISNKDVMQDFKHIMSYWLTFGISGYRLDAATHLFDEFDHNKASKVMKDFNKHVQDIRKDAVLLAEADVEPEKMEHYIGKGDKMNMLFNFLMNNSIFLALARKSAKPVIDRLKEFPELPEKVQWLNFVRNLDELDLERLSEEEREEVFEAFAPHPSMRIYNRGIRRRISPMLEGNPGKLKMVYNLLFALPGAPMIVYGDEIGMGDNLLYDERTCVRTPMQWNSSKNGGFSDASPDKIPILPIDHGIYSYRITNVEQQQKDNDSILNKMKEFTRIRNNNHIIGEVTPKILKTDNDSVLGLKYSRKGEELLIFINLSDKPFILKGLLDITKYKEILNDSSYGIQQDESILSIGKYGFRWFSKM